MPALRDFLGKNCPRCSNDILQQLPSTNRMPNLDVAWCASCDGRFSVEDLGRGLRGGSLLGRLFGRPNKA